MLALSLHIGTEHYAIPATQVVEVLPLTALNKIPQAPEYIAGLLNYRGTPIPIVDLCALITGDKHYKVLTTRIILISYHHHSNVPRLLGVIAERVTETLKISDNEFKQSGVSLEHAPYLGPVSQYGESVVQLINADVLLTDEVHSMLFQEPSTITSHTA